MVNPRAILDATEKRIITISARKQTLVIQPIANPFTDLSVT
jgi:hypothetical protein